MFKFLTRCAAVLIGAALLIGSASPAFGATLQWADIQVTLQSSDQGQPELVVRGELPADAQLPYEGELAVPAGTELRWMGEILGGPVADDPSLQFTKTVVEGMDVYRFTLKQARVAQFEGNLPGAWTTEGATRRTSLTWTAWRATDRVTLRERMPEGAQVVQADDNAELVTDESGWSFYAKTAKKLKAGETIALEYSYTAPVAPAPTTTSASGGSASGNTGVVFVVAIIAMAAGMALMALLMRPSRKPAAPEPTAAKRPAGAEKQPVAAAKSGRTSSKVVEVEDEEDDEPAARSAARMGSRPKIAVAIILGVLVFGVAVAISFATSVPVVDGKMTKFFGSTSTCTSASVPFTPASGTSVSAAGNNILKAFQGKEGIGNVTVRVSDSVVDVEYCESTTTEAAVKQAIASAGVSIAQ